MHCRVALFTPLADQGDLQLFSVEQRTTALPIQVSYSVRMSRLYWTERDWRDHERGALVEPDALESESLYT